PEGDRGDQVFQHAARRAEAAGRSQSRHDGEIPPRHARALHQGTAGLPLVWSRLRQRVACRTALQGTRLTIAVLSLNNRECDWIQSAASGLFEAIDAACFGPISAMDRASQASGHEAALYVGRHVTFSARSDAR